MTTLNDVGYQYFINLLSELKIYRRIKLTQSEYFYVVFFILLYVYGVDWKINKNEQELSKLSKYVRYFQDYVLLKLKNGNAKSIIRVIVKDILTLLPKDEKYLLDSIGEAENSFFADEQSFIEVLNTNLKELNVKVHQYNGDKEVSYHDDNLKILSFNNENSGIFEEINKIAEVFPDLVSDIQIFFESIYKKSANPLIGFGYYQIKDKVDKLRTKILEDIGVVDNTFDSTKFSISDLWKKQKEMVKIEVGKLVTLLGTDTEIRSSIEQSKMFGTKAKPIYAKQLNCLRNIIDEVDFVKDTIILTLNKLYDRLLKAKKEKTGVTLIPNPMGVAPAVVAPAVVAPAVVAPAVVAPAVVAPLFETLTDVLNKVKRETTFIKNQINAINPKYFDEKLGVFNEEGVKAVEKNYVIMFERTGGKKWKDFCDDFNKLLDEIRKNLNYGKITDCVSYLSKDLDLEYITRDRSKFETCILDEYIDKIKKDIERSVGTGKYKEQKDKGTEVIDTSKRSAIITEANNDKTKFTIKYHDDGTEITDVDGTSLTWRTLYDHLEKVYKDQQAVVGKATLGFTKVELAELADIQPKIKRLTSKIEKINEKNLKKGLGIKSWFLENKSFLNFTETLEALKTNSKFGIDPSTIEDAKQILTDMKTMKITDDRIERFNEKITEVYTEIHDRNDRSAYFFGEVYGRVDDLFYINTQFSAYKTKFEVFESKLTITPKIIVKSDEEHPVDVYRNWAKDKIYKDDKKDWEDVKKTFLELTEIPINDRLNSIYKKIEQHQVVGKTQKDPHYNSRNTIARIIYIRLSQMYKSNCVVFKKGSISWESELTLDVTIEKNSVTIKHVYFTASELATYIRACMNNNVKVIVIHISIGIYMAGKVRSGHANILIFRVNEKTIERYEPHGSQSGLGDNVSEDIDAYLTKLFGEKDFTDVVGKIAYKDPSAICPKLDGLQAIENKSKNAIKEKEPGYCALWSLFFMEMVLMNQEMSSRDINKAIFDYTREQPDIVLNVIRGYVIYAENLIDDVINDAKPELGKFRYDKSGIDRLILDTDIDKYVIKTANDLNTPDPAAVAAVAPPAVAAVAPAAVAPALPTKWVTDCVDYLKSPSIFISKQKEFKECIQKFVSQKYYYNIMTKTKIDDNETFFIFVKKYWQYWQHITDLATMLKTDTEKMNHKYLTEFTQISKINNDIKIAYANFEKIHNELERLLEKTVQDITLPIQTELFDNLKTSMGPVYIYLNSLNDLLYPTVFSNPNPKPKAETNGLIITCEDLRKRFKQIDDKSKDTFFVTSTLEAAIKKMNDDLNTELYGTTNNDKELFKSLLKDVTEIFHQDKTDFFDKPLFDKREGMPDFRSYIDKIITDIVTDANLFCKYKELEPKPKDLYNRLNEVFIMHQKFVTSYKDNNKTTVGVFNKFSTLIPDVQKRRDEMIEAELVKACFNPIAKIADLKKFLTTFNDTLISHMIAPFDNTGVFADSTHLGTLKIEDILIKVQKLLTDADADKIKVTDKTANENARTDFKTNLTKIKFPGVKITLYTDTEFKTLLDKIIELYKLKINGTMHKNYEEICKILNERVDPLDDKTTTIDIVKMHRKHIGVVNQISVVVGYNEIKTGEIFTTAVVDSLKTKIGDYIKKNIGDDWTVACNQMNPQFGKINETLHPQIGAGYLNAAASDKEKVLGYEAFEKDVKDKTKFMGVIKTPEEKLPDYVTKISRKYNDMLNSTGNMSWERFCQEMKNLLKQIASETGFGERTFKDKCLKYLDKNKLVSGFTDLYECIKDNYFDKLKNDINLFVKNEEEFKDTDMYNVLDAFYRNISTYKSKYYTSTYFVDTKSTPDKKLTFKKMIHEVKKRNELELNTFLDEFVTGDTEKSKKTKIKDIVQKYGNLVKDQKDPVSSFIDIFQYGKDLLYDTVLKDFGNYDNKEGKEPERAAYTFRSEEFNLLRDQATNLCDALREQMIQEYSEIRAILFTDSPNVKPDLKLTAYDDMYRALYGGINEIIAGMESKLKLTESEKITKDFATKVQEEVVLFVKTQREEFEAKYNIKTDDINDLKTVYDFLTVAITKYDDYLSKSKSAATEMGTYFVKAKETFLKDMGYTSFDDFDKVLDGLRQDGLVKEDEVTEIKKVLETQHFKRFNEAKLLVNKIKTQLYKTYGELNKLVTGGIEIEIKGGGKRLSEGKHLIKGKRLMKGGDNSLTLAQVISLTKELLEVVDKIIKPIEDKTSIIKYQGPNLMIQKTPKLGLVLDQSITEFEEGLKKYVKEYIIGNFTSWKDYCDKFRVLKTILIGDDLYKTTPDYNRVFESYLNYQTSTMKQVSGYIEFEDCMKKFGGQILSSPPENKIITLYDYLIEKQNAVYTNRNAFLQKYFDATKQSRDFRLFLTNFYLDRFIELNNSNKIRELFTIGDDKDLHTLYETHVQEVIKTIYKNCQPLFETDKVVKLDAATTITMIEYIKNGLSTIYKEIKIVKSSELGLPTDIKDLSSKIDQYIKTHIIGKKDMTWSKYCQLFERLLNKITENDLASDYLIKEKSDLPAFIVGGYSAFEEKCIENDKIQALTSGKARKTGETLFQYLGRLSNERIKENEESLKAELYPGDESGKKFANFVQMLTTVGISSIEEELKKANEISKKLDKYETIDVKKVNVKSITDSFDKLNETFVKYGLIGDYEKKTVFTMYDGLSDKIEKFRSKIPPEILKPEKNLFDSEAIDKIMNAFKKKVKETVYAASGIGTKPFDHINEEFLKLLKKSSDEVDEFCNTLLTKKEDDLTLYEILDYSGKFITKAIDGLKQPIKTIVTADQRADVGIYQKIFLAENEAKKEADRLAKEQTIDGENEKLLKGKLYPAATGKTFADFEKMVTKLAKSSLVSDIQNELDKIRVISEKLKNHKEINDVDVDIDVKTITDYLTTINDELFEENGFTGGYDKLTVFTMYESLSIKINTANITYSLSIPEDKLFVYAEIDKRMDALKSKVSATWYAGSGHETKDFDENNKTFLKLLEESSVKVDKLCEDMLTKGKNKLLPIFQNSSKFITKATDGLKPPIKAIVDAKKQPTIGIYQKILDAKIEAHRREQELIKEFTEKKDATINDFRMNIQKILSEMQDLHLILSKKEVDNFNKLTNSDDDFMMNREAVKTEIKKHIVYFENLKNYIDTNTTGKAGLYDKLVILFDRYKSMVSEKKTKLGYPTTMVILFAELLKHEEKKRAEAEQLAKEDAAREKKNEEDQFKSELIADKTKTLDAIRKDFLTIIQSPYSDLKSIKPYLQSDEIFMKNKEIFKRETMSYIKLLSDDTGYTVKATNKLYDDLASVFAFYKKLIDEKRDLLKDTKEAATENSVKKLNDMIADAIANFKASLTNIKNIDVRTHFITTVAEMVDYGLINEGEKTKIENQVVTDEAFLKNGKVVNEIIEKYNKILITLKDYYRSDLKLEPKLYDNLLSHFGLYKLTVTEKETIKPVDKPHYTLEELIKLEAAAAAKKKADEEEAAEAEKKAKEAAEAEKKAKEAAAKKAEEDRKKAEAARQKAATEEAARQKAATEEAELLKTLTNKSGANLNNVVVDILKIIDADQLGFNKTKVHEFAPKKILGVGGIQTDVLMTKKAEFIGEVTKYIEMLKTDIGDNIKMTHPLYNELDAVSKEYNKQIASKVKTLQDTYKISAKNIKSVAELNRLIKEEAERIAKEAKEAKEKADRDQLEKAAVTKKNKEDTFKMSLTENESETLDSIVKDIFRIIDSPNGLILENEKDDMHRYAPIKDKSIDTDVLMQNSKNFIKVLSSYTTVLKNNITGMNEEIKLTTKHYDNLKLVFDLYIKKLEERRNTLKAKYGQDASTEMSVIKLDSMIKQKFILKYNTMAKKLGFDEVTKLTISVDTLYKPFDTYSNNSAIMDSYADFFYEILLSDILMKTKKIDINKKRKEVFNAILENPNNVRQDLIAGLIEILLIAIGKKESDLVENVTNKVHEQAILLTLIRMYFTYNIITVPGHIDKFLQNSGKQTTNVNYADFIANLKTGANSLSLAGKLRTGTFSYDHIIKQMNDINNGNGTDDQKFEKTIPLQLNGIYHYFEISDYFTNSKDIENNKTITKFAGGGKKKTLRRKVIKQSFHPNHAAKKTNKKHKRRQDDSRRLTESDANVAEKTNEGVRSRRLTDSDADVSTADVSTADTNVSASTGTKETNQGVRQPEGVRRGTKCVTRRRKGNETTVERTVGGKKTRRSLRP